MLRPVLLCTPLLLFAGCMSLGAPEQPRQVTRAVSRSCDGYLFVANGSGDTGTLTENLTRVAQLHPQHLEVDSFSWSHGRGQALADHIDRDNHEYQSRRFAEQITRYQRTTGNNKVYLIGHSTGCIIVLGAAEQLPPGSIERIVLLAPSVSDTYDLRPAMTTSRRGIVSYYSTNDQLVLGLGMALVGSTDPENRSAAGLNGFKMAISTPADTALYQQKLKQIPWNESMTATGNDGGHYGSIQQGFLQKYVVPEMLR